MVKFECVRTTIPIFERCIMSELLETMKAVYIRAKEKNFEWKPIYSNNMLQNGIAGIYTDMFFEWDGKYRYIKYSIEYQSRCDGDGLSHSEEGTAFYILHALVIDDLEEKFEIPEPDNHFDWEDTYANMVNNYGRFRYAFSDEETAKSVVSHELLGMIYPYGYLLSDAEAEEWNQFIDNISEEDTK
jgi:hypothetical protein